MTSIIFFLFCRYECIQNELLDSLQHTIQFIAPYQSKGIEKAGDKCPKKSPGKVFDKLSSSILLKRYKDNMINETNVVIMMLSCNV